MQGMRSVRVEGRVVCWNEAVLVFEQRDTLSPIFGPKTGTEIAIGVCPRPNESKKLQEYFQLFTQCSHIAREGSKSHSAVLRPGSCHRDSSRHQESRLASASAVAPARRVAVVAELSVSGSSRSPPGTRAGSYNQISGIDLTTEGRD